MALLKAYEMTSLARNEKSFARKLLDVFGSEMAPPRQLKGNGERICFYVCALFSIFMLYAALAIMPFYVFLAIYFGGTSVLVFLYYPGSSGSTHRITALDGLFIGMTIATVLYFMFQFEAMEERAGIVTNSDYFFGLLAVIVSLESCRRTLGLLLPALAALFLLYCLLGPYFPAELSHKGFSVRRISAYMYSLDGIFGVVTRVYATYIFLFILFGAFLSSTKTGDFFINIALCLVGSAIGGAAKVAIIGSGLIGSIVGSGSANVAITGVFTIPMMKRTGFQPHMAGAIESVASIGGHITPPIMGAVVFLVASFTRTTYLELIKISILPAALFYYSLYIATHFRASRKGIRGLEKSEIPPIGKTLKNGWVLFLPIATLVVLLFLQYSPHICAVLSIFMMIIASRLPGQHPMTFRRLLETLAKGAKSSLSIGATAGTMGIILGGITLPGLGYKFSSLILSYSYDILPLALVLVLFASYVLGMGMTVSSAYVLLSVLAAPALMEMGVPMVAAHLCLVWFVQSSPLTPPFCLAAFVAAGIADSNPMKTGFASMRLAYSIYIMPLIMIYKPLLLNGPWWEVSLTVLSSLAGFTLIAAALEGYWRETLGPVSRAVLFVSAALVLLFHPVLQGIGLLMSLIVLLRKRQLPVARLEKA